MNESLMHTASQKWWAFAIIVAAAISISWCRLLGNRNFHLRLLVIADYWWYYLSHHWLLYCHKTNTYCLQMTIRVRPLLKLS